MTAGLSMTNTAGDPRDGRGAGAVEMPGPVGMPDTADGFRGNAGGEASASAPTSVPASALAALKHYFGYDSFRPGQSGLVSAILQGRDVLGVMPTGAGKSICYQIPATLLPGLTIVISPLISLMRDQVDALQDAGIPAAYVNTTQSPDEQDAVLAQAAQGNIRMLYVAPERLETGRFRDFASHARIALVTVDEAHGVSQWGQDFRSSYLGIGEFIDMLPVRPIVAAFTATATGKVRRDIVSLIHLRNPLITVTGFDRPNLYFDVIRMETKRKTPWIAQYVATHPGQSGIVYCATRKETEAVAAALNQAVPNLRAAAGGLSGDNLASDGPVAAAYHGGMTPEDRSRTQRDFVTDRVPVVVATNAFGMGIDKSDVRYVIHHNMPDSIEAYYQEAGRAGRDGEPGRCTLLWNDSDIVTRRRLLDMGGDNERLDPEEQQIVRASKRRLLDGMIGYCRTTHCLHDYMVRYFADPETGRGQMDSVAADRPVQPGVSTAKCGNCSNCEGDFETIDVTDIARAISRCVHDVGQSYGMGKIVAVLRGSKAQDLINRGLDKVPSYGMLGSIPEARIRDVLNQMSVDGFLAVTEGRLPIVQFGPLAAQTVAPDFHYEIKRIQRRASGRSRAVSATGGGFGQGAEGLREQEAAEFTEADEQLFQRLRALRRGIAQEIGKPPYIVFSDRSLRDMVRLKPANDSEFLQVNGVGENKLRQYGAKFMEAIAQA